MITERQVNKTVLARKLGISRSSLYYRLRLPAKDEKLKEKIIGVLADNPSYGHRRVALALGINRKRARRVMRLYKIKPYKRKVRWKKRRDLRRTSMPYENKIKGICPTVPGYAYVCDFTHITYYSKPLYLATFMDLYTREIVGWEVSNRHTKELVLRALMDAVLRRGLPQMIHSDQGSEYCSKDYTQLLSSAGVTISMSKKSSPWENGYQESFYGNFKTDLGLEFERFNSVGELIEAIHHTVNYYNNERIHTTLKMPPARFRRLHENFRQGV